MTVAPMLLVVSTRQYRLGGSGYGTLIKVPPAALATATAVEGIGAGKGWSRILERTRGRAEAHSLLSRYFSF